MPKEIVAEEAKKDLQGMVDTEKDKLQKSKEATMSEAEKKVLEEKKKKEQEEKAAQEALIKKDAEILAKKPEERTPEEAERAKVLEEEKRKLEEAKLSADEKIKRIKEETQKRIDELNNKLKQIEDSKSKEADELRNALKLAQVEIENLNKKLGVPAAKEDIEKFVSEEENKRLTKYLEEDKVKPREQRREMLADEWNDWFLEEPDKAIDWRSDRNIRRNQERQKDFTQKQAETLTNEFMGKHDTSKKRVEAKHPELNLDEPLKKLIDSGKTEKEAYEILAKDNPKLQIVMEIVKENPNFLYSRIDAPELIMAEMEKRLASKSTTTQTEAQKEIADLRKQVEDLTATIQALQESDEGINSTIIRKKEKEKTLTDMENILVDTMRSAGAPEEAVQKALKDFRDKQGKK